MRSAYAPLNILSALTFLVAGSVAFISHARAQSISQDSNFVPDSSDAGEPSGAFIDYAPPPVPTYNLSSPRRTDANNNRESQDRDPVAKRFQQEETLGRVQTKDGSIGLETDRRGDPSKIVPLNDFSQGQARKPDSFIGFSIVQPYDPK